MFVTSSRAQRAPSPQQWGGRSATWGLSSRTNPAKRSRDVTVAPLIDSLELAESLRGTRVCDIRWSLTDPNHVAAKYEEAHIPGAVFVDLEKDLTGHSGPGRHPLPSVEDFARTLGRLGISPDTKVVVYDDMSGVIAARLWWMLRAIRHEDVRLLDGGLDAWIRSGAVLESGSNAPEPSNYPSPAEFYGVVEIDQLEDRAILDARAPERYRGEQEPVDPKAGHIPGAVNMPTEGNLDALGNMRTAQDLRRLYSRFDRPVMSCGSGVTACHDALAMVVAGLPMPDVYIGSFSEWSRLDLPVKTGDQP